MDPVLPNHSLRGKGKADFVDRLHQVLRAVEARAQALQHAGLVRSRASSDLYDFAGGALRGLHAKQVGRIGLGFTRYSGQPNKGLTQTLMAAGFTEAHIVEKDKDFCALAISP